MKHKRKYILTSLNSWKPAPDILRDLKPKQREQKKNFPENELLTLSS